VNNRRKINIIIKEEINEDVKTFTDLGVSIFDRRE
jgi:hypothetical protein